MNISTPQTLTPKISCLCVTCDRWDCLQRAFDCYIKQTYPNKELVIVTEGSQAYKNQIAKYIQAAKRDDVKTVFLTGDYILGTLRNQSLAAATGAYVCQWDDDDLNHSTRLQTQFTHMQAQGADASFFTDQLQYFWPTKELFWSDWTQGLPETADKKLQLIPGTLMAKKSIMPDYPETGEFARAGEDSYLLDALYRSGISIGRLRGQGFLYVYCFYNEKNTFSYVHHRCIPLLRACTRDFFAQKRSMLEAAIKEYPLPEGTLFYLMNLKPIDIEQG